MRCGGSTAVPRTYPPAAPCPPQWRAVAGHRGQQRASLEACLHKLLHRQQLACFNQWRGVMLHRCLAWPAGVWASPESRCLRLPSTHTHGPISPSYHRRAKLQAQAHYERRLLAASLAALQRPLQLRPVAEACLRRLLHRQLGTAFAAWRSQLAGSQELAAAAAIKGRSVVLRMQNRCLASAWQAWRWHAARNCRLRAVLMRIQQRHALAALHSWRDWTACMQRARHLMQRSLAGTQLWALRQVRVDVAGAGAGRGDLACLQVRL